VTGTTTYHYRVMAKNTGGNSAYSNTLVVTTPIPPILAPSNLTATALTSTSISLTWSDNSNNETQFQVHRSPKNANQFSILAIIEPNVATYLDNTVSELTGYDYKVRAHTSGNLASGFSNIATATTPLGLPAAPTQLTAQLNSVTDVITLQWVKASANTVDFIIERSLDGSAFTQLGTTASTTFEDNNFGDAPKTFYRVMARNAAGNSTPSNTATVIITGIEAETSNSGITLSPNPAVDHVILHINKPEAGRIDVQMFDLAGKEIQSARYHKNSGEFFQRVNIINPVSGIILMKVSMNKLTTVKKVFVK
jgi:fibronectin type 3 domain-containing protein